MKIMQSRLSVLAAMFACCLLLTGCPPSDSGSTTKKDSAKKDSAKKDDAKKKDGENTDLTDINPVAPKVTDEKPPKKTVELKPSSKDISGDCNQWCGSPGRNNVRLAKNLPTDWDIGEFDDDTGQWKGGGKHIKWVARLGSQTYGNAVVADGRVYVGTNNGGAHLKRFPEDVDLGCLLCFRESDGKFLWQHSSRKLKIGRVQDWPYQGICDAPLVEGDRLWFVSSRGEVVCLDTGGHYDGKDDGEVKSGWGHLLTVNAMLFDHKKDGKLYIQTGYDRKAKKPIGVPLAELNAGLNEGKIHVALHGLIEKAGVELPEVVDVKVDEKGKRWSLTAKIGGAERNFRLRIDGPRLSGQKLITSDDVEEADVIWKLDMVKDLGIFQHNMCSCSVTVAGNMLFVNTSNGVDNSHANLPSPNAPSFIALDKRTGKVLWTDKSPGNNILHGQWSSPAYGELGGVPQVIFAGGDGWVYSFHGQKFADGKPELLWKFDANPKESKWALNGNGDRNNIIATPVLYDGHVFVAVGQDPEHGTGIGHLWRIDPTKRGDVSPELAFHVDDPENPIPHRRLQAVIKEKGEVARDNPNSAAVWHYAGVDLDGSGKLDKFRELMHRSCGTVAIKDDLLFITDFGGLVHCLDAKTGKRHWIYDMLAETWGSPLIADGKVFIGDADGDIAIFNLSADPAVAMILDRRENVKVEDREKDKPAFTISMEGEVFTTPIVANNVLYISTNEHLFAIQRQGAAK